MSKKIFVSYATPDKEIVEELIHFLQSVDGIKRDEIYYAAKVEGQIPSGTYFCKEILSNLRETQYTIVLLSKHYEMSFNCAIEFGASFCAKEQEKHIILTIPPYDNKNVQTLIQGIQTAGDITEQTTLTKLKEALIDHITEKSADTTVWSTEAQKSAANLKKIVANIPDPHKIQKADYDNLNRKLKEANIKLKNQDQEIEKQRKQLSELRQLKDQEKVKEVLAKYDGVKSQFDNKIQEIKEKLRKHSPYVRHCIFSYFSGVREVSYDIEYERQAFSDAYNNGYIDEEGNLNKSNRAMLIILDRLRDLQGFLSENENAYFIQDICNDEGCEPYLSNKKFWNALFD